MDKHGKTTADNMPQTAQRVSHSFTNVQKWHYYFPSSSALFYCLFSTQALIFFFSSSFYSICCPFKELSHCTLDALLEFVSSSSLVFHTLLLSSMCGESFLTDFFTRKRLVFLSNSMRTLSLVFVKRYSG